MWPQCYADTDTDTNSRRYTFRAAARLGSARLYALLIGIFLHATKPLNNNYSIVRHRESAMGIYILYIYRYICLCAVNKRYLAMQICSFCGLNYNLLNTFGA